MTFLLGAENQSELAAQLEINSVTAGRIIDRLEASGWVERRPNQMDRRAYRIHLKTEARPILDSLSAIARDEEATALAGIDARQQAELLRLLVIMVGNLNASAGAGDAAGQGSASGAASGAASGD